MKVPFGGSSVQSHIASYLLSFLASVLSSSLPYCDFDLCANADTAFTASTLLLLPTSASAFRSPR